MLVEQKHTSVPYYKEWFNFRIITKSPENILYIHVLVRNHCNSLVKYVLNKHGISKKLPEKMKFKPWQRNEWDYTSVGIWKVGSSMRLMQVYVTTDREETSPRQAAAWQGSNMEPSKADVRFMLLTSETIQNRIKQKPERRRDYISKARKTKRAYIMLSTK